MSRNNGLPWAPYMNPAPGNLGAAPDSPGGMTSSAPGGASSWFSNFGNNGGLAGIGQFLSGMFGNSSSPWQDAANTYNQWASKGAAAESPYSNMGAGAIPAYQKWAASMSDPTSFINNMMKNYQQSPTARYMQQQALRAAGNQASADGTLGSTPYTMQNQQNAENISQQDMGNWIQNVLGVNSQYGGALGNQINAGQESANALLNLYAQEAGSEGDAAFGAGQGQNQDSSNMWDGGLGIASGIASAFGL